MLVFILKLVYAFIMFCLYFMLLLILPKQYIKYLNQYYLTFLYKSLGMNIIVQGFEKIPKDNQFIIQFNHRSMLDFFILPSVFGNMSCIVDKYVFNALPFYQLLQDKFEIIELNEKGKNVIKIGDHIKSNKYPLAIPSDGMNYPKLGNKIGDFKTGAFVSFTPMLPVLIRYKDYEVLPDLKWDVGENIAHSILKIFLNNKINIHINILDLIIPKKEWTIEEYKNHVFCIMNDHYKNLE
jgi:1-acyl-sn-glycerol-3-phosphate acyltransferase